MVDEANTVKYLRSVSEIKSWIENEIRTTIKKYDALLDRKIFPDGSHNAFKSEEGQIFLYHIGVLSEILTLLKE